MIGPLFAAAASRILLRCCCNLLGLMPFFDFLGHGGNTATGSLSITAGLAICSFCLYHGLGIREQGFFTYIKNLFPHVPWWLYVIIIPIELVAHFVKPCALAIRLFANMLAGHMVIATLLLLVPLMAGVEAWFGWGMMPISLGLGLFIMLLEILVAFIQAYIFTLLTAIFIGMYAHPAH